MPASHSLQIHLAAKMMSQKAHQPRFINDESLEECSHGLDLSTGDCFPCNSLEAAYPDITCTSKSRLLGDIHTNNVFGI